MIYSNVFIETWRESQRNLKRANSFGWLNTQKPFVFFYESILNISVLDYDHLKVPTQSLV